MIRFQCHRGPLERFKIWLERPHYYAYDMVEHVFKLVRDLLDVDDFYTPINSPNKAYFRKAKFYLLEKGERAAKVSLMRSPDDKRTIRGSTRIPS